MRVTREIAAPEVDDDDRRLIAAWAADCAERVLPLFEAHARRDSRPREALEGARAFADGGRRTVKLRSLAMAGLAAAREVDAPAAAAAARATGTAAAAAFIHAHVTPPQMLHAYGPAAYAARARELEAGGAPGAAGEELRRAARGAPPALRALLRRLPAPAPGRRRLDALCLQLDAELRRGDAARPAGAKRSTSAPKDGPAARRRPLSGGNPRVAKAVGDGPVQAYLAAMPGWKRDVGRRLDALVTRAVPGVRKAVKWNSPLYGVEGRGWFLGVHTFTRYVKLAFFNGSSLRPTPPGKSKGGQARYLDVHEDDALDEAQLVSWFRQAAALPGWGS